MAAFEVDRRDLAERGVPPARVVEALDEVEDGPSPPRGVGRWRRVRDHRRKLLYTLDEEARAVPLGGQRRTWSGTETVCRELEPSAPDVRRAYRKLPSWVRRAGGSSIRIRWS